VEARSCAAGDERKSLADVQQERRIAGEKRNSAVRITLKKDGKESVKEMIGASNVLKSEMSKKAKQMTKKLHQIDALEKKAATGTVLEQSQLIKVDYQLCKTLCFFNFLTLANSFLCAQPAPRATPY